MADKERKDNSIGYQALRSTLADGSLRPVYIFHGEESYLREFCIDEIRKQLIPAGLEEFNYHRLEGKTLTMQQLGEIAEAMPMMAEHTLIVVNDCDLYRLPEDARELLILLLEDFPDYCCLIFVYNQLEYKPNKTYKKLYAALESKAQSVVFEAQDMKSLLGWISRRFRAQGHTIAKSAAEHLVLRCGELMNTLIPEIEKISAYARHQEITQEDIDAVAEPQLTAVVFDMTRAVTRRQNDRAAALLGELLKKQEQPVRILAILGNELRRVYTARLALDEGKDRLWLMKLWSMRYDSQARALLDTARGVSREWCRESLTLCQTLDRRMKSETGIDSAGELETLMMQLAQMK